MNYTENNKIAIGSPNSNMRELTKKDYIKYDDPGHGWLAVPVKHLGILDIANKITSCSYKKGNTTYLEEDCDLATFLTAWELYTGLKFKDHYVNRYTDNRSNIRNYASY